jgi:hypothetical protein
MNKEQQELLGEAYENYVNKTKFPGGDTVPKIEFMYPDSTILSQEEFINKCKTNNEFSKKWGLKIEERELSLEERREISPNSKTTDMFKDLAIDFNPDVKMGCWNDQMSLEDFNDDTKKEIHKLYDRENIPTKLITITYNDKIIKSYE